MERSSDNCIVIGENVRFDVTGLRMTQSLSSALEILDQECKHGSGGTWDIARDGRTYVATPTSGPFDTLYYSRTKKRWEV